MKADCTMETIADLDLQRDAWAGVPVRWPMQEFDWIRLCASTFSIRNLHVISISGPGTGTTDTPPPPRAIAPLRIRHERAGVRRLVMLGGEELFEPSDILWTDDRSLKDLAWRIAQSRLPVTLRRLPASSPAVEALRALHGRKGLVFCSPDVPAPIIHLDPSWSNAEAKLNSRRRSDLRRAGRKAEEFGDVKTEILTPSESEVDPLLDVAFEVESRSWKGKSGSALAMDEARGRFYRDYARAAARRGILRICFLHLGMETAAMQIALVTNMAFWLLKIGYDARFCKCSPGNLLIRETIQHAVRAGLSRYEFIGACEKWTKVWTPDAHDCVAVRIYPWSGAGIRALAVDGAAKLLRCLRQDSSNQRRLS